MDSNEDVLEPRSVTPDARQIKPRRSSSRRSLVCAGITGLKWSFFVAGLILLVPLVVGLFLLIAHRKNVPDAENSALIVKKVLALLPKAWPGPNPNAGAPANSLREAMDVFRPSDPTPENVQVDDAAAQELRRELKARSQAVQIARTLANYRRGRHEFVIGPRVMDTSRGR